jgi:hypothetical protein
MGGLGGGGNPTVKYDVQEGPAGQGGGATGSGGEQRYPALVGGGGYLQTIFEQGGGPTNLRGYILIG